MLLAIIFVSCVIISSVSCQCDDITGNIRVGGVSLSCSQLVAQYPYFCGVTGGIGANPDGLCCASCATLLAQYPYFCGVTGGIGANPDGMCCASCATLPSSATQCTDFPDLPGFGVSITGTDLVDLSCAEMIAQYSRACELFGGNGGSCCQSCQGVDFSCTDVPNSFRPFDGAPEMTCSEMVAQYPYLCTVENGIGLNPGGTCCEACANLPPSATQCTDFPGSNLSLGDGITGKSCAELAAQYPYICQPDVWGGDGNVCCQSCQEVNAQCTDLPGSFSPFTGAAPMTCTEIANTYPYFCTEQGGFGANPNGTCCKACDRLSARATRCTDFPFSTLSITGIVSDKSCAELAVQYPRICDPQYWGGDGNTCCESCKGVDYQTCSDILGFVTIYNADNTVVTRQPCSQLTAEQCSRSNLGGIGGSCCASCPCQDNPAASVTVRASGSRCRNCSCPQLLAAGLKHLKKACCRNIDNAAVDCCQTCKENISCA